MEPRKEPQKSGAREAATEKKPRFQIVKLEERIAPRPGSGCGAGKCWTHGANCHR